MDQAACQVEIAARRAGDLLCGLAGSLTTREQHMRTDCGSDGHQERERSNSATILGRSDRKILVQEPVCGVWLIVAEQVHQWKSEVVQHVSRGDFFVEFDRVEQDRLLPEQNDVRKMQVTVASPHKSLPAALLKQAPNTRKRGSRSLVEIIDLGAQKAVRSFECGAVAHYETRNRGDPRFCGHARRSVMGCCDRRGNGGDKPGVKRTGLGEMIQRLVLVKPAHLD